MPTDEELTDEEQSSTPANVVYSSSKDDAQESESFMDIEQNMEADASIQSQKSLQSKSSSTSSSSNSSSDHSSYIEALKTKFDPHVYSFKQNRMEEKDEQSGDGSEASDSSLDQPVPHKAEEYNTTSVVPDRLSYEPISMNVQAGNFDNQINNNTSDNPMKIPVYSSFFTNADRANFGGKEVIGREQTNRDQAYLRLILLLDHANVPLYLFDSIMVWLKHTTRTCGTKFIEVNHPSRQTFLESYWGKMRFPRPQSFPVPLEFPNPKKKKKQFRVPSSHKVINAISFDFLHQASRILQDPSLFNKDTVLYNNDNPFTRPMPNFFIQNVHDGSVFQETVKTIYSMPENQDIPILLAPFKLYADKTHTDHFGKYNAEPLVAEFTFLKPELQGQMEYQLLLGLVADMEQKSSAMKRTLERGMPCRNYHEQLRTIIQAINRIMARDGFWVEIPWNGTVRKVKVYFILLLILGDAKSQDNLVGRYASNHANVGRLTFACDCNPLDASYPWTPCHYLSHKKIQRKSTQALRMTSRGQLLEKDFVLPVVADEKEDPEQDALSSDDDNSDNADRSITSTNEIPTKSQEKGAIDYLHSIAQYPVDNIFNYLYLGSGDNSLHGVFSATVCDIMHTLKLGIMQYVAIVFFSLMTQPERAMFDFLTYQIFRANRQTVFSTNSREGYPNTVFATGCSNLTRMTSAEWVGVCFVCASVCVMVRGQVIFQETMSKKWDKLVIAFNKKKDTILKKKQAKTAVSQEEAELLENTRKSNDLGLDTVQGRAQVTGEVDGNEYDAAEESRETALFEHYLNKQKQKKNDGSIDLDDPIDWTSTWTTTDYPVFMNFLSLFENLLTFFVWLKQDIFWPTGDNAEAEKEMNKAEEAVKILMDGIRRIAPRLSKKGQILASGWCIPKFHNLSHIITQIRRFGPPKFWDVEHGESNHKYIVKEHAQTCQKRGGGVFLEQLSQRMWGMQTLWLMTSWLGINKLDIKDMRKGKVPDTVFEDKNRPVEGATPSLPERTRVAKTNVRLTVTITSISQEDKTGERVLLPLDENCLPPPVSELQLPPDLLNQIRKRKREMHEEKRKRDVEYPNQEVTRQQLARNNVQVDYKYHTNTSGCTFPNFGIKWFQTNYKELLRENQPAEGLHKFHCFTEIKHPKIGNIRCHPNYQSGGPWRDWVLLTKTRKSNARNLAQLLCFVRSHKQIDSAPDMALVRTCFRRDDQDKELSSVLFHRWRKGFDSEDDPTVELVPIKNIIKYVGVVDENPEMIEERHGVALFLNSEEEREQLKIYHDKQRNNLCHDVVWQVLSINEWAGEFLRASRFCKNTLQHQARMAQEGT